ncbi:MAG: helix-turn-helix domain-containing protein [Deltaproteobacteria bacterium]|nr:helix-turn-helix domain-containing protein [Deltaproteobacteria bacterium]MBW2139643.1 helix-turn-helix domain-containing protein [Deltaproteobacteria bacterium]
MRRTELLQEIRVMRFEEAYYSLQERRMTQDEAACLLSVCARAFRRNINRYEEEGLEGLYDKRITRASHCCAPVDEVMEVTELYKSRYRNFTVKYFYGWYRRLHGGRRSHPWVKKTLQAHSWESSPPLRSGDDSQDNWISGHITCY